jgi:fructose-specific phosphotransferase system IIC component
MDAGSSGEGALSHLLAAHRELSALEWLELRRTMVAAAVTYGFTAVAALAAWFAANGIIVAVLREEPLTALVVVAVANLAVAVVGALVGRRLLRRPLFVLTRRETERDLRTVFKALS